MIYQLEMALANAITALTILGIFFLASKFIKNMNEAFRKGTYITKHYHVTMNNCTAPKGWDE